MTELSAGHVIKVAKLDAQKPTGFDLRLPAGVRKSVAARLGLLALPKLRFSGSLTAINKADWALNAQLGATVVQACVLTLVPVTTRIDIEVKRLFLADMQQDETEEEVEIPEDENAEPLGSEIDLFATMVEALSLALPLYPKSEGAELQTSAFTEPGKPAMSDDGARPFASLANLRDTLKDKG